MLNLFKKFFSFTGDTLKATIKAALLKVGLFLLMLVIAITAITQLYSYSSARYACYSQWVDSSIKSKYTLRGGCLVKVKDNWIPSGNYRTD